MTSDDECAGENKTASEGLKQEGGGDSSDHGQDI